MNDIISANLDGKIALITGAGKGLGAFYAEVLAKNGAHVVVAGRQSSRERLENVKEKIQSSGYQASSIILDMQDFDSFNEKIEEIIQQLNHIDILVNNAAVSSDKAFCDITTDDWDLHMDTNLKGLFFLTQTVAKHMIHHQKSGSIINIAAINGQKVRKNCLPFGVSKAGVIHLTKTMAYELIDYNIRVNAISLGLFASESVQEFLENNPKAACYLNRIPDKRAGRFADLEGPLLLLASDASSYMSGSVINVDGGFSSDVFMQLDF